MSVTIPDPRLEEPELLEPGIKPTGNVIINLEDSLARNIVDCRLYNGSERTVNLANGSPLSFDSGNTVSNTTTVNGSGFEFTTRSANNRLGIPFSSTGGEYIFEWVADYPATYNDMAAGTGNCWYFDNSTDRTAIAHISAGLFRLSFYDGSWTESGYQPCGNGFQHMLMKLATSANGGPKLFSNGKRVDSFSSTDYTAKNLTSGTVQLFNSSVVANSENPVGLKVLFSALHDGILSDAECVKRTLNSYKIFIPS